MSLPEFPRIGIRWTIGNAPPNGWEALNLSIVGAWKIFGSNADYVISVNNLSIRRAHALAGKLPCTVHWHDSRNDMPLFLLPHIPSNVAEGAGWKFAPLRLFPDRPELAIDNDCILWQMPAAIGEWLGQPRNSKGCVVAEDVAFAFGKFTKFCGTVPLNSGIRGFPAGWDFAEALREVLDLVPGAMLESEQDEQGLEIAALIRHASPFLVKRDEVTICSPFPPHVPGLGSCGAHFVGLNSKQIPWTLKGRPATHYIARHWSDYRDEVRRRVG